MKDQIFGKNLNLLVLFMQKPKSIRKGKSQRFRPALKGGKILSNTSNISNKT